MAAITEVSEITAATMCEFLRIAEPTTADTEFLTTCIDVAKAYIVKYCGLDEVADLDASADFIICVQKLVAGMYDSRALYIDNKIIDPTVQTILGLHEVNLL